MSKVRQTAPGVPESRTRAFGGDYVNAFRLCRGFEILWRMTNEITEVPSSIRMFYVSCFMFLYADRV